MPIGRVSWLKPSTVTVRICLGAHKEGATKWLVTSLENLGGVKSSEFDSSTFRIWRVPIMVLEWFAKPSGVKSLGSSTLPLSAL